MSSQSSSYYQPSVLLHQLYSSPKLGYLPPLSQVLTDNTITATTDSTIPVTTTTTSSNMIKNEEIMPNMAYYSTQPPSTILSNSDSPLTSGDLLTPTPTMTATTNDASNMLTTTPDTTSMYMNDPVTAAAAVASMTKNMIYDPHSTFSTSSTMDPLLATTTLPPTSVPFIYSNTPMYDDSNYYQGRHRQTSISSSSSADKAYSFVTIPGMNQRKRPRRRYDEIERLYHCTYSDCKKSYGTLNHLNSHVLMQNHGPKRHPSEFKEMRKEWRRQRKQREEQRKQVETSNKQQQLQQEQILQPPPPPTLTAAFQPHSTYTNFSLQSMPLSGFY